MTAADFAKRWRLDGQTAFVSGGTKGIGYAIADELLHLGATVAIAARDMDMVAAVVDTWKSDGFAAYGIAADLSDADSRKTVVDFLRATFPSGLSILVNNVGTNIRKASLEYQPGEMEHLWRTNIESAWELSLELHPLLKKSEGGSIVNIGSIAGSVSVGTGAPYAMTKAALDQLTRYLAVEWAAEGIRVNSVNPGYTRTPLTESRLAMQPILDAILAHTPLNRIGEAEDVAALVAFLCLPAARQITGQTIAVDGGYLAQGG